MARGLDLLTMWSNLMLMPSRAWWARVAVVAIAYLALGRLALLMAIPPGYATAVWPAAGIALVAVTRWGWSAALGVWLGSFATNVAPGAIAIAAVLGVGAAMAAAVGALLIRRAIGSASSLERGADISWFFVLGGPIACLLSSGWGVGMLYVAGALTRGELGYSWVTWWVGDTIGVILVAPIVLALFGRPRDVWRPRIVTVALPLIIASIGVIVLFVAASSAQNARIHAELGKQGAIIAHAIGQRTDRFSDTVQSTADFIAANPELTRAQFATFASGAFGRAKEIHALSYCRREPMFNGHEPFVVTFVEPTQEFVGFDFTFEPTRADAVARAKATHAPAATRPIRLLGGDHGFALVAPVIVNGELEGVAAGGIAIDALIGRATRGLDVDGLRISIRDMTGTPEVLVGTLEPSAWEQDLVVGGETWRIGVSTLGPRPRTWEAWLVLAAGLAVVCMLGTVLLAVTGGRARIARAEERYRDLYEHAPDLYLTLSKSGEILECNATAIDVLGHARDALVAKRLPELAEPESAAVIEEGLAVLAAEGSVTISPIAIRRADGSVFDASVSATAVYRDGQVVAARALLRDVSELVAAERDHRFQIELGDVLHTSESIHAALARSVGRIFEHLDIDECHYGELDPATGTYVVDRFARGKRKQTEDSTPLRLFEADLAAGKRHVDDVAIAIPLMRGGACVAFFAAVSHGVRRWASREVALVESTSERMWLWSEHLRSVHNLRAELAARTAAERELRDLSAYLEQRVDERTRDLVDALGEKEALLKEIHHRVKNNLQVISSMINLQARRISDVVLKNAFDESQQRIQTIALVHERLYQSRDLSNIGFDDYLRSLVDNVMYGQNAAERGVIAALDIAPISLPIQIAIPCGLIVNELVTNALKHAFPAGKSGTIEVAMRATGRDIELSVRDDGRGMPTEIDPAKAKTLGLDLIYTFAEQLGADVAVRRGGGTAFTLQFKTDPTS